MDESYCGSSYHGGQAIVVRGNAEIWVQRSDI